LFWRTSSLALLTVLLTAWVHAADAPPKPTLRGFKVTSEGGVEGKQSVEYGPDGRPAGGGAMPATTRVGNGAPLPAGATVVGPSAGTTAPSAPAPAASQGLTTPDGRKLPFSLEGAGRKEVDGNVDFSAALKRMTKSSGLLEERYEKEMAPLSLDPRYSRENLVTFDSWRGKYDTYGRRKADLDLADTLGAEVRPKDTIEVKSVEMPSSPWSRRTADVQGLDGRLTTEKVSRYDVKPIPFPRPVSKSIDQLSMQDINRYQFRRNRSDEPGLDRVRPGSDKVDKTGSGGK
jgi:hypothetical protein